MYLHSERHTEQPTSNVQSGIQTCLCNLELSGLARFYIIIHLILPVRPVDRQARLVNTLVLWPHSDHIG